MVLSKVVEDLDEDQYVSPNHNKMVLDNGRSFEGI
jgi:hypothetical protein